MRCKTCSYWESKNSLIGECRFSPPQLCYFKANDGDNYPIMTWLFPETEPDEWCGEWHEVGTTLPNGILAPRAMHQRQGKAPVDPLTSGMGPPIDCRAGEP